MSINLDKITTLPEELNYKIFSFLDPITLGKSCQISKKFNELVSHDNVWKDMFPNVYFPSVISAKKYIDSQSVNSRDAIIQRINNFCNYFALNTVFEFNALFPYNPGCMLTVKIGYGNVTSDQNAMVQETCLFMKKLEGKSRLTPNIEISKWMRKVTPSIQISNNPAIYKGDRAFYAECYCDFDTDFLRKISDLLHKRQKLFL